MRGYTVTLTDAEYDALKADAERFRWIEEQGMWNLNEALERYPHGPISMAIDEMRRTRSETKDEPNIQARFCKYKGDHVCPVCGSSAKNRGEKR